MKNQISSINVPVSTLNAIKNLLFSEKEGGVDLSSIVTDLTVGNANSDLVAINVGLTFKGIKPDVDKTTRYAKDYRELTEYTFVSYSMIRDLVTYERKVIAKWDSAKNDLCPCSSDGYRDSCSLSAWYDKDTDRSIPTQELVKQWAKEDKPQQSAV